MDAMETVKQAANRANIPVSRIGLAMGKSSHYMAQTISRGSTPKADTLARMLNVCGYGLYAMPYEDVPDSAIQITATKE